MSSEVSSSCLMTIIARDIQRCQAIPKASIKRNSKPDRENVQFPSRTLTFESTGIFGRLSYSSSYEPFIDFSCRSSRARTTSFQKAISTPARFPLLPGTNQDISPPRYSQIGCLHADIREFHLDWPITISTNAVIIK